eukprot:2331484-Rhodomonas_salina.2
MPATDFRDKIHREILEDAAILPCNPIEGPRGRTLEVQKPLRDIQFSRNSVQVSLLSPRCSALTDTYASPVGQDLVRPLGAREWRVIALKKEHAAGMEEGGVLLFVKFFDNQTSSLELVGNFVIEPNAAVSSLGTRSALGVRQ